MFQNDTLIAKAFLVVVNLTTTKIIINILYRRYAAERKLYEFYEQLQHQSHHHRY